MTDAPEQTHEREIAELVSERDALRRTVGGLNQRLAQADAALAAARGEYAKLVELGTAVAERQREQRETERSETAERVAQARIEVGEKVGEIRALRGELEKAQRDAQDAESRAQTAAREVVAIRELSRQAATAVEEAGKSRLLETEGIAAMVRQERDEARRRVDVLEGELRALKANIRAASEGSDAND